VGAKQCVRVAWGGGMVTGWNRIIALLERLSRTGLVKGGCWMC
jgi:hypothetical protein